MGKEQRTERDRTRKSRKIQKSNNNWLPTATFIYYVYKDNQYHCKLA